MGLADGIKGLWTESIKKFVHMLVPAQTGGGGIAFKIQFWGTVTELLKKMFNHILTGESTHAVYMSC